MTSASTDQHAPSRGAFLLVQILTLARIPLVIAFAILLQVTSNPPSSAILWTCIVLLSFAEITDALDGFTARRLGVVSKLGAALDPLSDSISRLIVYWALGQQGWISPLVPLVMAIRDVLVGYCRIAWVQHGSSPSARLSGKLKAVVQGTVAITLVAWVVVFDGRPDWLYPVGSVVVIIATVLSAIDYLAGTVQIVTRSGKSPDADS